MKYVVCFVLFSFAASAQINDIVEHDGIKAGLHESNIGKLLFTDHRIDTDKLTADNFLKSYTLTHKSDLFFVAYFDNSLSNYKHQLSPGVSNDSLYRAGNYQFTIFIDNKEIYRSNLLPGAPSAQQQNKQTVLNRPLIDNKSGQGSWSESFWNRFLSRGGDAALTDGKHDLRMEIRAYVQSDQLKTSAILASGALELFVSRHPKINVGSIELSKVIPYPGFEVSTDSFDTGKIKELKGAIEESIFKKIKSIVVVKNGKILIEEYFNGANRNTLHDPRSVGKSFVSTLIGMAIADGHIKSEKQPLKDFYELGRYKNFSSAKENTTIRELLTMSSGFDGNDEDDRSMGNEENMYPSPDWVSFALDLPCNVNSRKKWHYFTAGVVLLGDIVNKSVPGGLEKYAHEKLFKPLGILHYKWQYTPQNVPNTAGGIQMNAMDFAKYGQLYKNKGVWEGQSLFPETWAEKSFAKQQQITSRNEEYYGFLFWNKRFFVNGKSYEANYCAGNGGNYILVFKDLPLVMVITASAYGQPYAHEQVSQIVSDYLLKATVP